MSKKNNNDEFKLKAKFLINIESRTDEKKTKFTKWLNAQTNPQNSFLSLIEHCIDRFGYEDVTDHDIAKKLHTEILYYNNSFQPNDEKIESSKPQIDIDINEKKSSQSKLKSKKIEKVEDHQDDHEEENNIDADLSSF